MKNEIEAVVNAPAWKSLTRRGKGFSLSELGEVGLTAKEAVGKGIPVDRRRRTSHPHNLETLRRFVRVREIALIDVKGIGRATAEKLRQAGIRTAYDLAAADASTLVQIVPFSEKTIQKWRTEAQGMLTEKPSG